MRNEYSTYLYVAHGTMHTEGDGLEEANVIIGCKILTSESVVATTRDLLMLLSGRLELENPCMNDRIGTRPQ